MFGTGNATQVNTITTAVNSALMNYHVISKDAIPTSNLIQGIIIAVLVALILLGGVKRIAQVTEKLVPFMALFYIVLAIGVILLNLNRIPSVFVSILEGAFRPSAVTGGIVGSMLMSVKKGVSRGIFSNEAGLGTGSIAHACADTKKPVKQGMFGIFEVFTDTIVICTLTALVILCSGTSITYGQAAGAELTISGFTLTYGNCSPRSRCAASPFPRFSDGDFTVHAASSFCSPKESQNILWPPMRWLPSLAPPQILA